jgi:predicted ATPase
MDVDTIEPGADFAEVINAAVGSCEVLVTVIGKSWLSLADANGKRRLDDQQDLVRLEIQSALEQGIRVIPALVQGARMPRAGELPDTLAKLAGRHAFEISYARWQYDVERLITAVEMPIQQKESSLHNLRRQLTSFVGRRSEVASVTRTLSTARLVTLTGAGGIGKTRLAIQAGSEMVKAFRDGVWLVELAPIASPDLVPAAIAAALSVREQSGRVIAETVTDYLRPRHMLVVLDNCEHLVEAAARLVEDLLLACPDLRILATSREALGIGGEEVLRVLPLSLPDPADQTAAENVAGYEAVALFCDRATTAVGSFSLTPKSSPLVVQLCRRVDGIPLAIELAAAKLKVLSLEQIVLRLDDRFRLLTGGSRTALPRQQTLRATIDWSYQLLPEAERTLLRRLSVFSGGSSLEATEAVCAGEHIDAFEVLDLLTELTSKSMVVVTDSRDEARYGLLETIRQYGHDQLTEAGEADALRRRHRDWFVSLAGQAERELQGPEQLRWSELLETELENLRAAFEGSMQAEDTAAGLRLATALARFWYTSGHLSDFQDWLNRALARGDGPTSLRAQALSCAAGLASFLGDNERATRLGNEGLDLFRRVSDQRGVGFALRILGLVAGSQDEYQRATALIEESLDTLRKVGDKPGIAQSLFYLADSIADGGDHESAVSRLEEALALFRELGDRRFIAKSVGGLGYVALSQSRYAPAAALLGESLVLSRELKDQSSVSVLLYELGTVERSLGNVELAKPLLEESLSLFRRLGQSHSAAYSLCELGIVAGTEGDLGHAAALLQESLSLGNDRYSLSRCLEALAGLACRREQPLVGATLFGAAEAMREKISRPLALSEAGDHDAFVAAAESSAGPAVFRNAWLEGQAMTQEQAIAFASDQSKASVAAG